MPNVGNKIKAAVKFESLTSQFCSSDPKLRLNLPTAFFLIVDEQQNNFQ